MTSRNPGPLKQLLQLSRRPAHRPVIITRFPVSDSNTWSDRFPIYKNPLPAGLLIFLFNDFSPKHLPEFRDLDFTGNAQLIVVVARRRYPLPEDQAIEFPAHDKAAGNLHKFAALSTRDKPPHRLDMFETHIVKLRAGKAKRTAQDAAHQCRRPRRER